MHNKFTMEMSICQAENGFSLDELVKKDRISSLFLHSSVIKIRVMKDI